MLRPAIIRSKAASLLVLGPPFHCFASFQLPSRIGILTVVTCEHVSWFLTNFKGLGVIPTSVCIHHGHDNVHRIASARGVQGLLPTAWISSKEPTACR